MSPARAALQQVLGYQFRDPAWLDHALRHRSVGTPNNERLEFLGDSLLNCVVACLLYERLPKWPEGDLSRLRAALVNQNSLVEVAARLDLGQHLVLGEGELKSGGSSRPSILADAFEALLGAIYKDADFATVIRTVEHLFAEKLSHPAQLQPVKDAKTSLQEWLQAVKLPLPHYRVTQTAGDAHAQTFTVTCLVEARGLQTEGSGPSRRSAEQQAADAMLRLLLSQPKNKRREKT